MDRTIEMPNQPSRLILASQSPRRRQLLAEAGYQFEVILPADGAEDGARKHEGPSELVVRLARQKGLDVARRVDNGVVIGCDTVVECGGTILEKPVDREHACQMIRLLRGRTHHVYSGVCLIRCPDGKTLSRVEATQLLIEAIPDDQLEIYLDSNVWQDKAGAFGYQDRLSWIRIVDGSESNVVGLPMELLAAMIEELDSP
jgi:septum formation protein